ncbi:MAG: CBS domain-containing protein [Devosia sp.]
MNIQSILSTTTSRLTVVSSDRPFLEAAKHLSGGTIRMVVVCDENSRAIGVVTRTDAMRHLLVSTEPLGAVMSDVMSHPILAIAASDDLFATWQMMLERGRNHVPVLEPDGSPIGVLNSDDALRVLLQSEQYEERLLSDYVAGIGYQ